MRLVIIDLRSVPSLAVGLNWSSLIVLEPCQVSKSCQPVLISTVQSHCVVRLYCCLYRISVLLLHCTVVLLANRYIQVLVLYMASHCIVVLDTSKSSSILAAWHYTKGTYGILHSGSWLHFLLASPPSLQIWHVLVLNYYRILIKEWTQIPGWSSWGQQWHQHGCIFVWLI
jgi:hypothetical protein